MNALQVTTYDFPTGLGYGEFPEPVPGPGQVALDMEYAGANYAEAL